MAKKNPFLLFCGDLGEKNTEEFFEFKSSVRIA